MTFLKESGNFYRIIALINGLIPLVLIIGIYFIWIEVFHIAGGVFEIGYFLYGWTEFLALSTFVSIVPNVASWDLYGLTVVGSVETATLFINVLIMFGGGCTIIGSLIGTKHQINRSRYLWLIGGILTFPLGILALIAFIGTRSRESEKSLRERVTSELRKNKLPYILIIPFVIFLIYTYIIPILRGFYITLFSYPSDDLSRAFIPVDYSQDPLLWTIHAVLGGLQNQNPVFIGLENFFELFSHTTRAGAFQKALNNNIFFVIIFVPGTVIVSLLLAVLLNNKLLKGEDAYTTIFYMPVVTSILVIAVIWLRVVFDPDSGLLTLIFQILTPPIEFIYSILNLITLGMIPANKVPGGINWLADYLMESIALMGIWRRVGFDVLILLAGLKSIPDSLYEAAEIDGHGGWSKFKNITLPMLKGPLGVVIILEIINGWLVFQELYGLNVAGADNTLAIYLIYNYADPRIMTFASTVGYFIFAMSAFISLVERTDARGVFKLFSITCMLSIMFSIPSNRAATDPKSLGFSGGLTWLTYDFFFLLVAFACLIYYIIFIVIKEREIESDLMGLRNTGFFTLFISVFFLLNGYSTFTRGNFGVTPIGTFPSFIIGLVLIIIGLLMAFAYKYVPLIKSREDHFTLMSFGALILIFANFGWLILMPLVPFTNNELFSIIIGGSVMIADIVGFFGFGLGMVIYKHENRVAFRISGSCLLGWAVLSFIWRFLSPIYRFIPQIWLLSPDMTLLMLNLNGLMNQLVPLLEGVGIPVIYLFTLNGILLSVGLIIYWYTLSGIESLQSLKGSLKDSSIILLLFGGSNILGTFLMVIPLFIGVELGYYPGININRILLEVGFIIKTFVTPFLGILSFWNILNHLRGFSQVQSQEENIIDQRSVSA